MPSGLGLTNSNKFTQECLQVFGSTTAKWVVAPDGAVWNLLNCLKWCHLSQRHLGLITNLKMKKALGVWS